MPFSLLPTLLLQILIVGYSPGPANLFALTMAIHHGFKTSIKMWFGLLTGFTLAVCLLAVFTHFIGMAMGSYVTYLKYLGAGYILYLAYHIWKSNGKPTESSKGCTFTSGLIVQFTNAKMLLFDLTVFSTFVLPYSHQISDLFEVAAWLLIAGPGANLIWLSVGSYLRRFFDRYRKRIDIISVIALAGCAFYILFG